MYEPLESEPGKTEVLTPEEKGEDYLSRQREALALALGQSLEAGQNIPLSTLLSAIGNMSGEGRQ